MTSSSLPCCPFCHADQSELIQLDRRQWTVVCERCGASGPITDMPAKAREAWGAVCCGAGRQAA